MAITKQEQWAKIHEEALKQFNSIQSAMREERLQCLQDRRFAFIPGAQWEGSLSEQFKNKPRFEVNKILMAVMRTMSEHRNNPVTVDFVDKHGDADSKLADTCDDLYRADENDSGADEAYDNAFEEAVSGGFGAFRLTTQYEDEEDEDSDDQRIRIEPIFDADTCVFFDLDAKRQDKADAKHCFVLTSMTVDAFIAEWGDDPAGWPKNIHQGEFDWCSPDIVFVAEYYKVVEKKEVVRTFKNLIGEEEKYTQEELEEVQEELIASGYVELEDKKKTIKRRRVRKYLMSGNAILEDCGFVAGKNIPIVPVYGRRFFIDNVERCMGIVRVAKDAQRIRNMQYSKIAEISAVSSVSKPILTPEQIAGHQVMWSEDNLKQYPYLLINPVTGLDGNPAAIGPQSYTKSPEIPQATAALMSVTDQDIKEVLGTPMEQVTSNISGKAVEMIQNHTDMPSFIYMSNFAKAIRRAGEVWLSMAKELYTRPGREMKGVGSQGEKSTVVLKQPMAEDGKIEYANDLSKATFDVAVDVGPSSSTRKQAIVRELTGMMQMVSNPEDLQVLQAAALMNMEGEGLADIREYYRKKMVQMGVVKPNEEEMAAMAQAAGQPNAQEELIKAATEQANAQATKDRVSTLKTMAEVQLTKAKTLETLAGLDNPQ